jgi:hypothetical protein
MSKLIHQYVGPDLLTVVFLLLDDAFHLNSFPLPITRAKTQVNGQTADRKMMTINSFLSICKLCFTHIEMRVSCVISAMTA